MKGGIARRNWTSRAQEGVDGGRQWWMALLGTTSGGHTTSLVVTEATMDSGGDEGHGVCGVSGLCHARKDDRGDERGHGA